MKRPAQPEEIAPAFVFLAIPSCCSYILPIIAGTHAGHRRQQRSLSAAAGLREKTLCRPGGTDPRSGGAGLPTNAVKHFKHELRGKRSIAQAAEFP
jgi:hypothetical protein